MAVARVKRRPATGIGTGLGRLSKIGRAALASRGHNVTFEREMQRELLPEPEEIQGKKFNPREVEDVLEYSEIALRRQNKEMMRRSVLYVCGWKDAKKVREFFEHFFEEEQHPVMQEYGMQLYLEYLKHGGKPLGGNFARIDERFARLHKQHGR